jgi:hypothetical protein
MFQMIDPDDYGLLGKEELVYIGEKTLSDLWDAAPSELKKLQIQRYWYQALHKFSANIMQSVMQDDFEADRCPSDMERCKDGSCMPPGQC